MAYKGQPAPTTVYSSFGGKVSDGKSVKVTVGENKEVKAGHFYFLNGFLGCAFQGAKTGAGETAEVVLNIEPAEYETSQLKAADKAEFTVGKDIFWDKVNKYFTVTGTDIYAGKVTSPAGTGDVILFKLAERPYSTSDVDVLAAKVGDLADLETTVASSVIAAINSVKSELDDKKAANVAAFADPEASSAEEKINAIISALITAGLMASGE